MEAFIAAQSAYVLKAAYTEMLDGCLVHPNQWEWYAIWMIELKGGGMRISVKKLFSTVCTIG